MHTEVQKAYLAGLFDGEGHVQIQALSTRAGSVRHTLDVRITNTNGELLRALAQEWGGKLLTVRRGERAVARGWKESFNLRWVTQQAVAMLREVRPYLRMKDRQADVALLLMGTMRPREHRTKPLVAEEVAYREQLRMQLRALNQKGGVSEATPILMPEKPTLTCQYCGKSFNSYQKLRKYCSKKCSMAAGRDAYVDRHTYEKTCPACGRVFIARLKQKYCSIRCGRNTQLPPVPKGTKRNQ